jgi:hypothetical protein
MKYNDGRKENHSLDCGNKKETGGAKTFIGF